MNALTKRRQSLITGARHYAAAEKSDPFALGVALSEIAAGKHDAVRATDCSMYGPPRSVKSQPRRGQDVGYNAKVITGTGILPNGKTYSIQAFCGVVRP